MSYFTEIDAWLTTLLLSGPEDGESEEDDFERVKSQIKAKLLESYRNGQKAGLEPNKPSREAQAGASSEQKRRFKYSRKQRRQ